MSGIERNIIGVTPVTGWLNIYADQDSQRGWFATPAPALLMISETDETGTSNAVVFAECIDGLVAEAGAFTVGHLTTIHSSELDEMADGLAEMARAAARKQGAEL